MMAVCEKIRIKKRQICVGDLRQKIILQTRSLTAPTDADFTEGFVTLGSPFAAIKTLIGTTIFDGVDTDVNATHDFFIRYRSDVTAETWILWDNRRFDILRVENFEGRKTFLRLRCTESGDAAKNMSAI